MLMSSMTIPFRSSGSAYRQSQTASSSSLSLRSPSQPRHEEEESSLPPVVVPSSVMSKAVAAAREALEQMCRDSNMFQNNPLRSIPRIQPDDLLLGNRLGQGGYCMVNEVTHQSGKGEPNRTYALKRLKHKVLKDSGEFRKGVMNLAIEAAFLANLQHPNIIHIHGISTQAFGDNNSNERDVGEGAYGVGEELRGDGFYLVLDVLSESLSDRIVRWKMTQHRVVAARLKKSTNTSGGASNGGSLRSLLSFQSNQEERRLRTQSVCWKGSVRCFRLPERWSICIV